MKKWAGSASIDIRHPASLHCDAVSWLGIDADKRSVMADDGYMKKAPACSSIAGVFVSLGH